ncbi:hypothetical protein NPIL_22741 [Nephila pilipes]|uniref:Uncharacterized protein n=1 Tax=Nephila pilipes TaxID=299642 RepID=A0A8X6I5Z6_NEPPI|nr:hypothetical protein NPIL_22741 [Nephila pilipes]
MITPDLKRSLTKQTNVWNLNKTIVSNMPIKAVCLATNSSQRSPATFEVAIPEDPDVPTGGLSHLSITSSSRFLN